MKSAYISRRISGAEGENSSHRAGNRELAYRRRHKERSHSRTRQRARERHDCRSTQQNFFHHQYRKGEYEAALQTAKKINMPEFHWMQLMTAAACGMLDRHEEARTAIESLRKHNPTFLDLKNVREDIAIWDPDKDEVEKFLLGLQKAGLKYGSAGLATTEARDAEGFWVAVLPFKYSSGNADLTALAEGLTEDIVTGMSRFPYLRVVARSSTARYAN